MSRLFTWLAGLFGVFLMIYGVIILSQTLYWGLTGTHSRMYNGETDWEARMQTGYFILRHGQTAHLSVLLILAGLLIVMLTYPRSKARK